MGGPSIMGSGWFSHVLKVLDLYYSSQPGVLSCLWFSLVAGTGGSCQEQIF